MQRNIQRSKTIGRAGLFALGAGMSLCQAAPSSAKTPAPPYEYGPPPEWNHYKALAEAAVRRRMIDPDSAQFEWPYGYAQGPVQPLFAGKVFGYKSCGYVNARNRMGGYTGRAFFAVVIDYDQVVYVDVGKADGGDIVGMMCANAVQNLKIPPASAMAEHVETAPASWPDARSVLGLKIRPTAQGAYVEAVAPNSDAARAGIEPNMIIAQVNGIVLGSLGDAMLQVINASGSPAQLTILGRGPISLARVHQDAR